MGFALAEAARDAGASVTLIAGPVNLATPDRVNRIDVVSAKDMLTATTERLDTLSQGATSQDTSSPNTQSTIIFIGTAAVADYRPDNSATQKIKKTQDNPNLTLQLIDNPDIITTVAHRESKPFTV